MQRVSQSRRGTAGFSLIELLIVVTIILILAAIAIPKLIAVKMVANEAATVSNMRTVDSAETAYASQYPAIGFSASLAVLGGAGVTPTSAAALLLDSTLARAVPKKSGYKLTYAPAGGVPCGDYALNADATAQDTTGVRHFFTDATGVIRYNVGGPATANSTSLGQ
ncbi:MAG: prepilin-type N-terminal cleavage/methylation domain-containing protein [Terriglobales bacterium]